MRRLTWLVLMCAALALAACVPVSLPGTSTPGTSKGVQTPAATGQSSPTQSLSTVVPSPAATQAPSATAAAAATATRVASPTAAPSATQAAAPSQAHAATATRPSGTAAPASTKPSGTPGVVTFTSPRFGLTFDYQTSAGGQAFAATEAADRIFVYAANQPAERGQYVQIYQKPAGQSLEDAIVAQVLKGYSTQDCLVTKVGNPEVGQAWPASYSFARIEVPRSANDSMENLVAKAAKCPQPYAAIGGLAYFVADSQHPDRFLFFSIGQYGIPAGGARLWQSTVRFIDSVAPGSTATAPATGAAATAVPGSAAAPYVDDRSTARSLVVSYFNAINHYEYSRAYYYWGQTAGLEGGRPAFEQFRQSYLKAKSVDLTVGQITGGVAAGQIYYFAPVTTIAHAADGSSQTTVACYRMHLSNPSVQGVPPFAPLAIESVIGQGASGSADAAARLSTICGSDGQQLPVTPEPDPGDISANRYLDDRTDGVSVLRSLFNAVNRREYVRAYSYWESSSPQRPQFEPFQQGYADTERVEFTPGLVMPDAGAGNIYYQVPAVLIAHNRDGSQQTFAGCYTLHMGNPGMQVEPPFAPLGIQRAVVRQVPNGSAAQPLLQTACQQ